MQCDLLTPYKAMTANQIKIYCGEVVSVARLYSGVHNLSVSLISTEGVTFSLPRLLIKFISQVLSAVQ